MKSVLALVALVGVVSIGCEGSPEAPPPATPAAPAPPPAAAPVADTPPVAPVPQKQLVTITTKSPDAKVALLSAWDLIDNGRYEEALLQCKKAVAADPDFAFGHTCVGSQTPGAGGEAELDRGAHLAAGLPDAERLTMEGLAAARHQDTVTFYADVKRVADLAPDDYHAQAWLAGALIDQRDFSGAAAVYKKVLDLNPNAGFAWGALTFIHTQLREYDDALTASKKYVESAPTEAGAHRSVAYALLNLNRPKDADAELEKAVDLAPKSRWAYNDLAVVKAIEGDFAGARDAIEKSKVAEVQPTDGLDRSNMMAWTLLGEGKKAEAFAVLDATEKDSDARKLPWPGMQAETRAWALWALGKPGDSLKAAEAGMARCDHPESSDAYKEGCHRNFLTVKAYAQIEAGKIDDAQKTVALLRDDAKKWQGNNWIQVEVDLLSDQVTALAKKDAKGALAVLDKCPPDDIVFKLSVLRQAQKAGNKAGAEQVRKDLLGRPVSDVSYPLIAREAKK
jgi:Flp pilus assembly protein TadD